MKIEEALSLARDAVCCSPSVQRWTDRELEEILAILKALAELWPSLAVLRDGDGIGREVQVLAKKNELSERLCEIYSEDEIGLWFSTPHSLLGGARPMALIRDGRHEDVEVVIDQLLSGAYV